MKQPLWAINLILLILTLACISAVLLWQPEIPAPVSLTPRPNLVRNQEVASINLKSIYEYDIFKTYIGPVEDRNLEKLVLEIPAPPNYMEPKTADPELINFLEPLPIAITGIMVFGEEESNRAIIKDTRNQEERVYQVGDSLEDAQIIRILRNKVVIVRSNSQQETLFLRDQDVIDDLESLEPNWAEIITPDEENKFTINTIKFTKQVKNIGKLIDTLNLITAYKAGTSIGVKIGSDTISNLANALGLQNGDIITKINTLEVASTKGRMQVYDLLVDGKTSVVSLDLIRNEHKLTLSYNLVNQSDSEKNTGSISETKNYVENSEQKFKKIANRAKEQDLKNIAQFKNKISQSVLKDDRS